MGVYDSHSDILECQSRQRGLRNSHTRIQVPKDGWYRARNKIGKCQSRQMQLRSGYPSRRVLKEEELSDE